MLLIKAFSSVESLGGKSWRKSANPIQPHWYTSSAMDVHRYDGYNQQLKQIVSRYSDYIIASLLPRALEQ